MTALGACCAQPSRTWREAGRTGAPLAHHGVASACQRETHRSQGCQITAMLTFACLASHVGWKDFGARRFRCMSMSSVKCTGLPCLGVRASCR